MNAWGVGADPADGVELQGAELTEALAPDSGLADYLQVMWRLRLSEEMQSGPGRAMVIETLFNSDSSCLLAEPSRLHLERVASGAVRRTLSRGAFYINRRFAIAAAERIGKDPAEPPVGSGARLGRHYTAARLLHVRMISSRAAVAVVLCRAKSEDGGTETRVVATSVLVDGALFDNKLQMPANAEADARDDAGGEAAPAWKVVHEDVSVGGLLANVPVLEMPPLPPLTAGMEGESLISTAWPADTYEWFAGAKAAAATAPDLDAAIAAACNNDLSASCSLLAVAPDLGDSDRSPGIQLVTGQANVAACSSAKYHSAGGPGASIHYTVENAREIVPGELGLVLLWVTVDSPGSGARSFVAESNIVANDGNGWRRCHTTMAAACRHYLREDEGPSPAAKL